MTRTSTLTTLLRRAASLHGRHVQQPVCSATGIADLIEDSVRRSPAGCAHAALARRAGEGAGLVPEGSLSMSVSGMAAQLTVTKGLSARLLALWIARA
jgi:hypothetical protein